jgi:hypothetical protein
MVLLSRSTHMIQSRLNGSRMDDIIWLPHFPLSPTYFLDALNLFCHLMVTLVYEAFHLCNSCSPFFFHSHLNQMQKSISVNKLNETFNTIYEGNLFVLFVLMRSTESGCFRWRSWSHWKVLEEKGCISLVPWRLDLRCKSSWILNDIFIEN